MSTTSRGEPKKRMEVGIKIVAPKKKTGKEINIFLKMEETYKKKRHRGRELGLSRGGGDDRAGQREGGV